VIAYEDEDEEFKHFEAWEETCKSHADCAARPGGRNLQYCT